MYTYFTTLILVIHMSSCSAENAASPVYEVINEQARSDDKWSDPGPERLPYGNPLAGNSLQNARLHAANQQAMFNAERMRQHRAQLQRWNKAPIKDSYMRAYHESQENHQLALEQQEGGGNRTHPARSPSRRHRINFRRNKGLDPKKLTAADAIQNIRNHRSYGSNQNEYNNIDQLYQTIRLSPGPTYDEGVTIKPNGNVGVAGLKQTEESQLLTRAVPSVTQVYTKQFRNMQNYESAKDIETLNMLINKDDSQKQFTALNDILFHVNNEPENSMYNYILEDHRPITEVIDDLEDPSIRKPYKSPNQSKELVTTPNTNTMPVYYPANSPGDKVEIPNGAPLKQNEAEHVVQTHVVSTGVQHLNEDGGPYDELRYAANYEFGYHVRDHETGNDFGHHEAKINGNTNGHYHVLLPDGRMQRVRYFAGPEGFHADISYDFQ